MPLSLRNNRIRRIFGAYRKVLVVAAKVFDTYNVVDYNLGERAEDLPSSSAASPLRPSGLSKLSTEFLCLKAETSMLSSRLPLSRVLASSRPFRPPNLTQKIPRLRLFTQNSQLLLLSPATPRPQLPYLHAPFFIRPPGSLIRSKFQHQLSRLLTTERQLYFKDQMWKAATYIVYSGTMIILLLISMWGFLQEREERLHPSPPTWTFWSRVYYRDAWSEVNMAMNGTGVVHWVASGLHFSKLLSRLEDAFTDGSNLHPILGEEGDEYVPGVGKTGFDVSSKPEPWRRGYHATIMGCARAAERSEGWVRDITRNKAFAPEAVIGPSNPRPKPLPLGGQNAPLEENCVPIFERPEVYYMKILTTQGFTTRQRLDAALACADYLDFKGLHSSAEEMYDWGLDIAMGAVPLGANNVADTKSGIISADAKHVSSNLLLATTSLAMHHARNTNLATALPIFLSILRARRQLPSVPASDQTVSEASAPENKSSTLGSLISSIVSIIKTPDYPPPPPTGDEIPARIPVEACEEAAVMAYIGEILFASAPVGSASNNLSRSSRGLSTVLFGNNSRIQNQQSGLSWTRDAVELAETVLSSAPRDDLDTRTKCSECLEVGMGNWSTMVNKLLKEEREKNSSTKQEDGRSGNWFWQGNSTAAEQDGKWQQEASLVEDKMKSVSHLLREEQSKREVAGSTSGYFFI